MSWTSVLTCVALLAFVAPDATAAAMSVTVSGKTNGALAGRDVATIKINEAGVDAAVVVLVEPDADDFDCTGYSATHYSHDLDEAVFTKEVTLVNGQADLTWTVPNLLYDGNTNYRIMLITGSRGRVDRNNCDKLVEWTVSPSFQLAFSNTMPAFTNGLGLGDDRAIELRPGDSIDVEAFGISWKDAANTAVYLEASSNNFTCPGRAGGDFTYGNTKPKCWEQRNTRAKAAGADDTTWLYIGNTVKSGSFTHTWTLPAYNSEVYGGSEIIESKVEGKIVYQPQSLAWDLSDESVTLRLKMKAFSTNFAFQTCLQDFDGDNACNAAEDVIETYSSIFTIRRKATCGDKDGGGSGTAAVSDADCGYGYNAKAGVEGAECHASACEPAGIDAELCCVATTTTTTTTTTVSSTTTTSVTSTTSTTVTSTSTTTLTSTTTTSVTSTSITSTTSTTATVTSTTTTSVTSTSTTTLSSTTRTTVTSTTTTSVTSTSTTTLSSTTRTTVTSTTTSSLTTTTTSTLTTTTTSTLTTTTTLTSTTTSTTATSSSTTTLTSTTSTTVTATSTTTTYTGTTETATTTTRTETTTSASSTTVTNTSTTTTTTVSSTTATGTSTTATRTTTSISTTTVSTSATVTTVTTSTNVTWDAKQFAEGKTSGGDPNEDDDALVDPDNSESKNAGSSDSKLLWLLLLLLLLLLGGFLVHKRRAAKQDALQSQKMGEAIKMDSIAITSDHSASIAALERHAHPKSIMFVRGSVHLSDANNDINRENPAYGTVGGGSHGLIGNDLYGDVLAAGSSARLASNAVYGDLAGSNNRDGALGNGTYGEIAPAGDDAGKRVLGNETYQAMEPDNANAAARTMRNAAYIDAGVRGSELRDGSEMPFPGMSSDASDYHDGMPRLVTEEPEYGELNPMQSDSEYAEVGVLAETSFAHKHSSTAWGANPRLMANLRHQSYEDAVAGVGGGMVVQEEETYGVVRSIQISQPNVLSAAGGVAALRGESSGNDSQVMRGSRPPRTTHYNMSAEDMYQSNASLRGSSTRSSAPGDSRGTVMPSPPIIYMVAKNAQGDIGQIIKCEYIQDEGGYVDLSSGDLFVVQGDLPPAAGEQVYLASFATPEHVDDATFLHFLPGKKDSSIGTPLVQTSLANPSNFVRVPTASRGSRSSELLPFAERKFGSGGASSTTSSRSRLSGFAGRRSGKSSGGDGGPHVSPIRVMSVRRNNPLRIDTPPMSPASPAAAPASDQPSNDRAFFPADLIIEDDQTSFGSGGADAFTMDMPLSPTFLPGQARRHSGAIPMRSSSMLSYGGDAEPLSPDEESRAFNKPKRTQSGSSMLAAV